MSESVNDILIVGQMARDDALAGRLEGPRIHAIFQSDNPGLIAKVNVSRGQFYRTIDICNGEVVAAFAADVGADLVYVGADDPLASGVVDIVKANLPDVLTIGPTREGSRIEWDKFFSRDIIDEINPRYNPTHSKVTTEVELKEAIDFFRSQHVEVVIKPRGLTGGKGVKVMGEGKDFKTHAEAEAYGLQVLANPQQGGLLVERVIKGHEYTIQAFTDGRIQIVPKVTYDYPYREDGDKGPGTGGMGDFTMKDGLLPFLSEAKRDESIWIMQQVLGKLSERGLDYNGVLYGSFFIEDGEIIVTEFNARGGDPELVNTIELIDPNINMVEVLRKIATGDLSPDDIRYQDMASTLIYLVAPDYAYGQPDQPHEFRVNPFRIGRQNVQTFFAGAEQIPSTGRNWNLYKVGGSRAIALIALAGTPWEARARIMEAIEAGVYGPLRYRLDIGDQGYIEALPKAS